ncbi:AzlC family ABC transporter permease [Nocardioides deserti]|uniref:AzlC family ABC transporter permease n=1 Tax=Nocardioides deserti TaxID=1588644 RepID=A0ABR6U5M1_9ACTN|nr:AzlC family ABC transporter permease [Nocardioides deserti]MBC2959712.1 AzlC family ABC transporter permease [Nocardioides deserti]GGO74347.1 branched-chain amino acid transporter AzlC [Nocardioides deserti]
MSESFRRGLRAGVPFSFVGFLLAMSFGVLAVQAGFSALQAIVMSAVVHAGSAQFAATAILGAGGGVVPSVLAGSLMNARFLAMGIAVAPSLGGGPGRRALQGQTVVDPSWALANNGDGSFDRHLMMGATVPQYAGWVSGTVAGAFLGDVAGDPGRFGLDVVFPVFFLALLAAELRDPRSRGVALAGALIALALVPFTPPGVPVLVAGTAALVGLAR